jgi:toxin ParE1/3/4
MRSSVSRLPLAESDFRPSFRRQSFLEYLAAQRWYERQRTGLGTEFATEVDQALNRACAAPHRYLEVIPNVRRMRVRRFPFLIFYRLRGDKLIVLAVFHSRRNPEIWRGR